MSPYLFIAIILVILVFICLIATIAMVRKLSTDVSAINRSLIPAYIGLVALGVIAILLGIVVEQSIAKK